MSGETTAVSTTPQSIVTEARPVAFGLSHTFMNETVLAASVASQFPDGFPAEMGNSGDTVRVNSLSLTLDNSHFNVQSDISGGETQSVVGVLGVRRLRWIELGDGELLSIF